MSPPNSPAPETPLAIGKWPHGHSPAGSGPDSAGVAPHPEGSIALRERVRSDAENRPGIYRFIGPRGELLYIGKSIRIRTRLLSYFRAKTGKAREILRVAHGVEWEYVPTEFEALLREFRQIRAFKPRFNVHHRRDRRFAWVKLTREDAPRLLATRRPSADGASYFGPFPATRSLPGTIRDLSHVLGLRDCSARTPMHFSDQLDLMSPARTPRCARAELGSCPAPCAALVSRAAYRSGVAEAAAFLAGRTDEPLDRVRARMEEASSRHAFELAARWRDRKERIERLRASIVEFQSYLASLRFVYRAAVSSDGSDPSGRGAVPARSYLIVGGRVRMSFDEPGTSAGRKRPAPARAVRDEFRAALATASRDTAAPSNADAREELFLVARWFRQRPEELMRTVDPAAYLAKLGD